MQRHCDVKIKMASASPTQSRTTVSILQRLPAAVLSEDAFAYLEFHIEQGPILESEDASLGVVEALVGQTRMQFIFDGQANHAGTTPMHLRHDAMAAAARWIVAVEEYAVSQEGLVATVGKLEASPGAGNVIAGRVTDVARCPPRSGRDPQCCRGCTDRQCNAAFAAKRDVKSHNSTRDESASRPARFAPDNPTAQRRARSRLS